VTFATFVHKAKALLGTWQGVVIAVIVATQLLLPLDYYLARRDVHDERFAWRMFSPMRMTTCAPVFTVDDTRVPLHAHFHEAWIEIAKRGRFNVVEAMAAELCRKHPGQRVGVTLSCRYVDRPPSEFSGDDLCTSPSL
jgi:hypothetical protein